VRVVHGGVLDAGRGEARRQSRLPHPLREPQPARPRPNSSSSQSAMARI
jgi:hypothetical protein